MGKARVSHWIRGGVVALAGAIAVMVPLGAFGVSTGGSASASSINPLGVYAGSGSASVVKALGSSIGQQPGFAMDFLDGSTWSTIENPSWYASQWQSSGYKMIWGVPILPNSFSPNSNASVAGGSASGLAQGAGGAFNANFVTLAKALVADGQGSSIIRLGWEFNGGWFPWAANGSAANFIKYWQNIVTAMRSVPGQSFTFEWNPTLGDQGIGNLADYYPGNNYVDYIGADVYDVAWATYPGAAAEFSYMETETYGLNWLASFAAQQGKQITFPEWGLGWGASNNGAPVNAANTQVSGGDDPTFINDMATWIATHNVYEATFWDYGTSVVGGGSNPQTLSALGHDFGSGSAIAGQIRTTAPTTPITTTTTVPPTTVKSPVPSTKTPVAPTPTTVPTSPALKEKAARTLVFGTSTTTSPSVVVFRYQIQKMRKLQSNTRQTNAVANTVTNSVVNKVGSSHQGRRGSFKSARHLHH